MRKAKVWLVGWLAAAMVLGPAAGAWALPDSYTGGVKGLIDVDKPHTGMDSWGDFTGIDVKWTDTCWIASAASTLHSLGYGATADGLYQTLYNRTGWGNHGETAAGQASRINAYLIEQDSIWRATSHAIPTENWIMQQFYDCQRVSLGVDIWYWDFTNNKWVQGGAHRITYYGWVGDETAILDSDCDLWDPDTGLGNIDWYENTTDTYGGNTYWTLRYDRTKTDGSQYKFDYSVYNAILLCPIPEPLTMAGLLFGVGCLARYVHRQRRRSER